MLPNVNVVNRALFFAAYGPVAPISQGQCNTFDPVKKSFGLVTSTLDEDNLAWRVALDWKATRGRAAVRFDLARGQGRRHADQRRQHLDPERTRHPGTADRLRGRHEGGPWPDHRVQLNVGAFYYDYTDKQLSVYFADPIYTALSRLANVPESTGLRPGRRHHLAARCAT
jgi:iron complex outermembrane receptor protein